MAIHERMPTIATNPTMPSMKCVYTPSQNCWKASCLSRPARLVAITVAEPASSVRRLIALVAKTTESSSELTARKPSAVLARLSARSCGVSSFDGKANAKPSGRHAPATSAAGVRMLPNMLTASCEKSASGAAPPRGRGEGG